MVPAATTTFINFTPGAQVNKRQDGAPTTVRPTSIPAYASCGSSSAVRSSRYSSACSCGGITQTTSVAATPTSTVQCPSASPTVCNGVCRGDFSSDKFNCGACGNKCATGFACMEGQCYQPSACNTGEYCSDGSGACFCYTTTEGRGVCYRNGGQCGSSCTTSDNCPNGQLCIDDINCRACGTVQDYQSCPNASNTRRLFMRGGSSTEAKGSRMLYHSRPDGKDDSE